MTYSKIVAAVDRSPAGTHALRIAAQIAEAANAELSALRVVENPWEYIDPAEVESRRRLGEGSFADEATVAASRELSDVITSMSGARRARAMVRFGLPAVEIARWAGIEHADLIVLGRQPIGQFERRPAGRALEGTVRRARVPCLVVPLDQRTWHKILTALGTSPASDAVLEAAAAFGRLFGSEIIPVHVEPRVTPAAVAAGLEPPARAGGMATAPAVAEPIVRRGEPAGEILKMAREERVELIAVGYHPGEVAATHSAGVGPRVLHRAPCAVLTVPV